jgi:hypothetical protein
MNEFAHSRGQFHGWSEDRRRECLADAIAIINRHALASFGYVIARASFEAILPPRMQEGFSGPYGWAAAQCFTFVPDLIQASAVDGWIAYVFDSVGKGHGDIQKAFLVNHHDPRTRELFRTHSLRFEDEKQSLPLQAADLLAYELHRELPRQLGLSIGEPRFPLAPLSGISHRWQYDPDDVLREHVANWERVRELADS